MRIAVHFPDNRIIAGRLSEATADSFINHCLQEYPDSCFAVQRLPANEQLADSNGEGLPGQHFFATLSSSPFGVYWPQEIAEACGIGCFGEEYA